MLSCVVAYCLEVAAVAVRSLPAFLAPLVVLRIPRLKPVDFKYLFRHKYI